MQNGTKAKNISVGVSNEPLSDWTAFTGFSDADSTQVNVFIGGLGSIDLKTLPECNCSGLTRALVRQCLNTPLGWDWQIDLQELHACDLQLLNTLLAIGERLHNRGGQLTVRNLNKAIMPYSLRDQFERDCTNAFIQIADSYQITSVEPSQYRSGGARQTYWMQRDSRATMRL